MNTYCNRYGSMYEFFKNRLKELYVADSYARITTANKMIEESNEFLTALASNVAKRVSAFSRTYEYFVKENNENYYRMERAFTEQVSDNWFRPFYDVVTDAIHNKSQEFPKEKILVIFNMRLAAVKSKMLEMSKYCDNLEQVHSIMDRCCDNVKEIIEYFEHYLKEIEDTIMNVIANEWTMGLTDVTGLAIGERNYTFSLLVRFIDSFQRAYYNETTNRKDNFSSCMLINEETLDNFQGRKVGFILPMQAHNLVVMNTGDAQSTCITLDRASYDHVNYADVIENYYVIYTPTDSYKILSFKEFSKQIKEKENDNNKDENERRTNEIILKTEIYNKPLLITSDVPDDEIQDYKGLARLFNAKLIYWNKNEHFIERLI